MKKRFAAVLLAVLSTSVPAYADDAEKGIKLGGAFAGTITASNSFSALIDHGTVPTFTLVGVCAFDAALTPNNRLTIAFGGSAVAAGLAVPELTYVECEVRNKLGNVATTGWAEGGPASRTASMTGPWVVAEIDICVTALAVFGPSPVRLVSIPRTCESIV